MKFFGLFIAILVFLVSCGGSETEQRSGEAAEKETEKPKREISEYYYYGEKISEEEDAMTVDELMTQMADIDTGITARVEGEIYEVCQKRGCWLTMPFGDKHETMRVRFKDYDFFVPLDIAGQNVIIEGKAYWDTTSVERLRHYAEDAGKTEEEIKRIVDPKREVVFEAKGVLLKSVRREAVYREE